MVPIDRDFTSYKKLRFHLYQFQYEYTLIVNMYVHSIMYFISFLRKSKCAKKICCGRKYFNLLCIYLSVCMQPKEIFGNRVKNESARESRKREI